VRDPVGALTGCLLGQALGDALGFVVEARPLRVAREYVRDYLQAGRAGELAHPEFPFGQYSDDTQLARELLLSFASAGSWSPETFALRVAALFGEGRDVGAGTGTRAAAMRLLSGTPWNRSGTPAPYAGNGSAMRAAPLGLLFGDDSTLMAEAVVEQSLVTHLDPRCAAGALAVASAVSVAARGDRVEPDEFLATVAGQAATVEPSVADAIWGLRGWTGLAPEAAARRLHVEGLDPLYADEWRGISAFVTPSVVWSLYAFLRAPDDYWTTVCTAIDGGGDTDTTAAIAGAISGARLGPAGLPAGLVARVNDRGGWGWEALTDLARRAARLVGAERRS
jgi:ADP-ribosylglycohydrolase